MSTREFAPHPGTPFEPTGDPMKDGLGAAAWAKDRADRPDMTYDGRPRIQPMSALKGFHVDSFSRDPRGMTVIAGDDVEVGTVTDLWVDLAEPQLRYLTVTLNSGRTALLPIGYARVKKDAIRVQSIFGSHFQEVPQTKAPDRITLLEEDKIVAWYAGGYRYADPSRNEPLI
jgi:photosynthetic reaction center H subunit